MWSEEGKLFGSVFKSENQEGMKGRGNWESEFSWCRWPGRLMQASLHQGVLHEGLAITNQPYHGLKNMHWDLWFWRHVFLQVTWLFSWHWPKQSQLHKDMGRSSRREGTYCWFMWWKRLCFNSCTGLIPVLLQRSFSMFFLFTLPWISPLAFWLWQQHFCLFLGFTIFSQLKQRIKTSIFLYLFYNFLL